MTDGVVQTRRISDATVCIEVRGVAAGDVIELLRKRLAVVLVRERPPRVVVDLQEVTSFDSLGRGVLVAAAEAAEDLGIVLVVAWPAGLSAA